MTRGNDSAGVVAVGSRAKPTRASSSPLSAVKRPARAASMRRSIARVATWIAQLGVPSASWREVSVILGAILVGGTVFIRVTAMATPTDGENRGSSPLDARRAAGAEILRKS